MDSKASVVSLYKQEKWIRLIATWTTPRQAEGMWRDWSGLYAGRVLSASFKMLVSENNIDLYLYIIVLIVL